MKWLRRLLGFPPPALLHYEPEIEFIAEKTGPAEEDLKSVWRPILSSQPELKRAYLALVSYDRMQSFDVALCLTSQRQAESHIIAALHRPFYEMFASGAHLDILFLTAEQESRLRSVCSPFYETC